MSSILLSENLTWHLRASSNQQPFEVKPEESFRKTLLVRLSQPLRAHEMSSIFLFLTLVCLKSLNNQVKFYFIYFFFSLQK